MKVLDVISLASAIVAAVLFVRTGNGYAATWAGIASLYIALWIFERTRTKS